MTTALLIGEKNWQWRAEYDGTRLRAEPSTGIRRTPALSAECPKKALIVRQNKQRIKNNASWPKKLRTMKKMSAGKQSLALRSQPCPVVPRTGRAVMPAEGALLVRRYRLFETLGEGGSGMVFRAQDTLLDMPVAIKVFHAELTADPDAVRQLKREAGLAMRLSHPNIVRLHNLEWTGANFFMTMEYIEGGSIRDWLAAGCALPSETVMQILWSCARGLEHAHRQGVLHNDLKPDNLVVTADGKLKIIDFGVASMVHAQQSDCIAGTPAYMSPEQMRGEPLDERTDIYALGVIACELLTGSRPYPDRTPPHPFPETMTPSLEGLLEEQRTVVSQAIHPDPDRRWASADAFVSALEQASGVFG